MARSKEVSEGCCRKGGRGNNPPREKAKATTELAAAVERARSVGEKPKVLEPIAAKLKRRREDVPSETEGAIAHGAAAFGKDPGALEVQVSLCSGETVTVQACGSQMVRSFRDAVAEAIAIPAYRLSLIAWARRLTDDNVTLQSCGVPPTLAFFLIVEQVEGGTVHGAASREGQFRCLDCSHERGHVNRNT